MKYRIVKRTFGRTPYYCVQRKVLGLFWWNISFPASNGRLCPDRFYNIDGGYEAARCAMLRHINGERESIVTVMCEVDASPDGNGGAK